MPLWRALGKTSVVVKARHLPKTITALIVLLILIVVMFVVPVDFKLVSEGTLEPAEKKDVFVNVPGTVIDLKVKDKDEVQVGDVLVVTHNADLAVELQNIRGEQLVAQTRLKGFQEQINDARLTLADRSKLLSEIMELNEAIESNVRKIELREKQIQELVIRAPISGIVMLSWDVERSLMRRKLEPGQAIMSVADPEKDWELELLMPERRMGHVNRERKKALEKGQDLDVDYILATDPRNRFQGKVHYVDQVTRVNEEAGHTVLIRADPEIEGNDIGRDDLRPGAKVRARVDCGRSSVGYYLFHEAIAWVQTKLLF